MDNNSINLKYLIAHENDLLWGLTISTVGCQNIASQMYYPPQNHPKRYVFSTEKGRTLDEYQLIYITRGRGTFYSKSCKEQEIKEGFMFLLFPGEWHSYQPDKNTGWEEYWIGFKGVNIDNRVNNGFFGKERPIFRVGVLDEFIQLYKQAIHAASVQAAGFQQILAGIVNHLLGAAYSLDKNASFEEPNATLLINKAKIIIREHVLKDIRPEEVASQLNMSYSWLRKTFKEYTGFAPAQYIQELKVQKAKEMLTNTNLSSKEIAFMISFENPEYFSVVFKKRTGMTPMQYRNFTQGVVRQDTDSGD